MTALSASASTRPVWGAPGSHSGKIPNNKYGNCQTEPHH